MGTERLAGVDLVTRDPNVRWISFLLLPALMPRSGGAAVRGGAMKRAHKGLIIFATKARSRAVSSGEAEWGRGFAAASATIADELISLAVAVPRNQAEPNLPPPVSSI
jgi:hypothetical protein